MSLSQCFMSSIVTVSFLCQERNNRAIFPLALPKRVLAPGLGAALAAVRGVCFRDMGGFKDAVYMIPDSRTGKAYVPRAEKCTMPLNFSGT